MICKATHPELIKEYSVKVEKVTGIDLLQKACSFTMGGRESKMTPGRIYRNEHSPIRTQIFTIEMYDIPNFVSVHLVRHKVGVEHFVKSNREDRVSYTGDNGRWHPVDHFMFLNAQTIINMSLQRLCHQAHEVTVDVWQKVKDGIYEVDEALYHRMVPKCIYRGGYCFEDKLCGKVSGIKRGG